MRSDLSRYLASSQGIEGLIQAVHRAGEAILQVYRAVPDNGPGTQSKSDGSPVTAADLAAHAVLSDALCALLPDCPVVSEEDESSWIHRREQGAYWLIDPLDGTREFLKRNGEFTVNVALIDDGRPVFGLVGRPTEDEIYWGGANCGAWRHAPRAGLNTALHVAPNRFAASAEAELRVVVSRSHLDAHTRAFVAMLARAPGPSDSRSVAVSAFSAVRGRAVVLVEAGSSLKFCSLACAQADLYPRLAPTHEWDTAAAQAVLEGAGGVVLNPEGHTLRYGKPDSLNPWFIAAGSAPWIDAGMLAFLREAAGHRSD
jgi:3'(2'), 5'-bisphosphate nucleotidase